MSRQTAHAKLKTLLPAQFEEVVFQFGMPPHLLRREVALTQQMLDLIHYAEQQENGLAKLLALLDQSQVERATSFNQPHQHVAQQFNVAGDVHFHGDAVAGDKIVQNVTGNGNISKELGVSHANRYRIT